MLVEAVDKHSGQIKPMLSANENKPFVIKIPGAVFDRYFKACFGRLRFIKGKPISLHVSENSDRPKHRIALFDIHVTRFALHGFSDGIAVRDAIHGLGERGVRILKRCELLRIVGWANDKR
jgi:hypothetical protein